MGRLNLALNREELFGLHDLEIFHGVISDPPNAAEDDSWPDVGTFNDAYRDVFEDANQLFWDEDLLDGPDRPDNLVEIVTYSVFTVREGPHTYVFASDMGGREGTLKKRQLTGKLNIGWGGHVDGVRYGPGSEEVPDPFLVFQETHAKEFTGELCLKGPIRTLSELGWVYLSKEEDGISPYHLGHVTIAELRKREHLQDVRPAERISAKNPGWIPLVSAMQSERLAPWARYVAPVIASLPERR